MDLDWSTLALLGLLLGGYWYWRDSLGAREAANAAALETCGRIGVALLEGTVSFRRLRPVRGPGGTLELERTYVFEYTRDGQVRQQGFVVVSGQTVASVGL
ncbi:MAG: DUF3301 domain-containing protein [Steroidobacteraceae bacterium]